MVIFAVYVCLLADDGIFTVIDKALEHSAVVDFTKPNTRYPNGRMEKNAHAFLSIKELENKGI